MNPPLPQLPEISFDNNISSDFDSLKSRELKVIAVKLIGKIQSGEIRGTRLKKEAQLEIFKDASKSILI